MTALSTVKVQLLIGAFRVGRWLARVSMDAITAELHRWEAMP